jgi:aspartate aminotransferase
MKHAGLEVSNYRYYDEEKKSVDFPSFLADVDAAPNKSIFLLHACAHNPTGTLC